MIHLRCELNLIAFAMMVSALKPVSLGGSATQSEWRSKGRGAFLLLVCTEAARMKLCKAGRDDDYGKSLQARARARRGMMSNSVQCNGLEGRI